MTNEEAINIIMSYDEYGCGYCHQGGDEIKEAFRMAAEALENSQGSFTKHINYEEVLDKVTTCVSFERCYEDRDEVRTMTLKALYRNIPQKVKTASMLFDSRESSTFYQCPTCLHARLLWGQDFCDKCGQALKWN